MHHTALLLAALAASATAGWKVDIQPFNKQGCPADGKAAKTQYLEPGAKQCKTFPTKQTFTGFTVVNGTDDFDHMMKENYCTVQAFAIDKCLGLPVREFQIEDPSDLNVCQDLPTSVLGRSMHVACKKRPCAVCQATTTVYATEPAITELPGTTLVIRPSMTQWTSTAVVLSTTTNSFMIDHTSVAVVPSSSIVTSIVTSVVTASSTSIVHSWVASSDVTVVPSTAVSIGTATNLVTSVLASTSTDSDSTAAATATTSPTTSVAGPR